MCKWQSTIWSKYRCTVPAEPGSELCLFHQPLEKDVQQFVLRIADQIAGRGDPSTRNPTFSFVGYKFPCALIQEGVGLDICGVRIPQAIDGALDLSEAVIAGRLILNGIAFEQTVSLRRAVVHEDVEIVNSMFSAGLEMSRARFCNQFNCRSSTFRTVVDPSVPSSKLHCFHAIETAFARGGTFYSCHFHDTVLMTRSTSDGRMDFGHSRFDYAAHMVDVEWKGFTSFANVVAKRIFFTGATLGKGLSLCGASLDKLGLTDVQIGGILSVAKLAIREDIEARGGSARQAYLGEGRPTILPLMPNRAGFTSKARLGNSSLWSLLAKAFATEGERDKADAAYYFARIARLKEAIRASSWWIKPIGVIGYVLDFLLLRITTAYGASLSRLFGTWALLVGGFSSVYYLLHGMGIGLFDFASHGLEYPLTFGRALYFSIVTFTTLGYGDIVPLPGLGSGLVAAEAILGGITMALSVLVVGRKFMR